MIKRYKFSLELKAIGVRIEDEIDVEIPDDADEIEEYWAVETAYEQWREDHLEEEYWEVGE